MYHRIRHGPHFKEISMRKYGFVLAAGFMLLTAGTARGQAATTVCKDKTTSSASGQGACSGHGGVDAKATEAAKKAATKAATKAAKKTEKAETKTTKSTTETKKSTTKAAERTA